jgi:Stress responsive A/B Barrel Domain
VTLHVVLFTPRRDITDTERHTFGEALERALTSIPSVRGYRVGRRLRTGAAYDALPGDFEFCAVIEFDDLAGLRGYLGHPAHAELGRLFYTTSGDAFAADYEAVDTAPGGALARWRRDSD